MADKTHVEKTLVLIKPDGVKRGLIGRILSRFEDAGLKVIGSKMFWVEKDFAAKHYPDIATKHGKKVFDNLLSYITSGPVMGFVLEGVHAVEVVRKMVGDTYPNRALPGTIRGDFAHISREHADASNKRNVSNLIHASGTKKEAEYEIGLWFSDDELFKYKTVHEVYTIQE